MKKFGLIFSLLCLVPAALFAQGEEVGPIMGNPHLQMKAHKTVMKANAGTFDSTFIYTSDTIDLPVFDEFSRSLFQVYNADYNDVGVTFDKVYHLHDMSDVPLPATAGYSSQQTYRFTVDLANASVTQVPIDTIEIKIGDLSSYPVAHIPTDVYSAFNIYDTIDFPNASDTVWVTPDVVQDSATQFFAPINDPDLIWLDDFAFHNYSMALDPWSLGVVTFDGLDENGYPYAIGSTLTNYADYLTSKPIDMSAVSAGDSVYFSFLYQAQGLCDPPESIDSLVLEFYAKDLDQWNRIWSTDGVALDEFKHVHIRLENTDYFKKGFQFRFKNYGGLSGSLDHFHIDYVNLRALSGYQDTIVRDFAFVYPLYTLLDTYTSVPWDHYKNNFAGKMSSDVQVVVRNSDNVPENEQDGETIIVYNSVQEGSFVLDEALLTSDLNYSPMTTYYSFHDFSTGDRFDETKPGLFEEFDIISAATHQNSNFTQNDSTFSTQYFQNYYSYDDGTAEQAYGPTGPQSMLAIKYTPYEADSLIGAMIHFVPTVNDVSNNLFLLTVWDDNGGEPGNVIYEDNVFSPRQPNYEYDRNIFTTYFFMDTQKVSVTGTFYIGWRQFDNEKLGVGLDRNIINNDKTFYSLDNGNSWDASTIPGSVMIRPVFSTGMDAILGIETVAEEPTSVRIYPNPTTSSVNIKVDNGMYEGVEVFNIQGLKVLETKSATVDLGDQPNGVYFFRVQGHPETYKIIKQ